MCDPTVYQDEHYYLGVVLSKCAKEIVDVIDGYHVRKSELHDLYKQVKDGLEVCKDARK